MGSRRLVSVELDGSRNNPLWKVGSSLNTFFSGDKTTHKGAHVTIPHAFITLKQKGQFPN